MALEPGLVLFMEAPALVLERLCRQVLLVASLTVVKQVEKRIGIDPSGVIQTRIIEYGEWFLRVVERGVVRIGRSVMTGFLCIGRLRASCQ